VHANQDEKAENEIENKLKYKKIIVIAKNRRVGLSVPSSQVENARRGCKHPFLDSQYLKTCRRSRHTSLSFPTFKSMQRRQTCPLPAFQ
jgi:hypothetical protein